MASDHRACEHCASREGKGFAVDVTMAFQPIFDVNTQSVFAQEALLRGKEGQGAGEILAMVTDETRYSFDQVCRTTAIEVAARLGVEGGLSINFMPNAVYEPSNCIQRTLWAADKFDFDIRNIIFEFTEAEHVRDIDHLRHIIATYRRFGFRTAIDDFGAGFAGLSMLAEVHPDIVKIDRALVIGCDEDGTRREILRATLDLCDALGIITIAEGVETEGECETLLALGVRYLQGYHLARPQFEAVQTVPDVAFPRPQSHAKRA